jgi:hypothetical protein
MSEWKECREERFNEMVGVLPPAFWLDKGFLVGEPLAACHWISSPPRPIGTLLAAGRAAATDCPRVKQYDS